MAVARLILVECHSRWIYIGQFRVSKTNCGNSQETRCWLEIVQCVRTLTWKELVLLSNNILAKYTAPTAIVCTFLCFRSHKRSTNWGEGQNMKTIAQSCNGKVSRERWWVGVCVWKNMEGLEGMTSPWLVKLGSTDRLKVAGFCFSLRFLCGVVDASKMFDDVWTILNPRESRWD